MLDGFAIGIAFQAGQAVGFVVAVAVLVHDFSDGLNTVNVVVKNGGERRSALDWLVMDATGAACSAPDSACWLRRRAPFWRCCWPVSPASFFISAPAISCPRASARFRGSGPPLQRFWARALLYLATRLAL